MPYLRAYAIGHACGVAHAGALLGVMAQRLRWRLARQHGFQRVVVTQAVQRKMTAAGNLQSVGQILCVKQASQARAAAQMPLSISLQTTPALRHRQAHAHGGDYIVQWLARTHMHLHRAHGHHRQASQARDLACAQAVQRVLRAQAARRA